GLFPGIIDGSLIRPAAMALGDVTDHPHLAIWHGFSTVLLLSGITLGAGGLMYFMFRPTEAKQNWVTRMNRMSPKRLMYRTSRLIKGFARFYTRRMQNGYLRYYLLSILIFAILLIGYKLYIGVDINMRNIQFSPVTMYELMI